MNAKMMRPILVLTLLCLIIAGLLVTVNNVTAPLIAEQAAARKTAASLQLLPNADNFVPVDVPQEVLDANGGVDVYRAENGEGYVVTVKSKGFKGKIELMVSFQSDGRIGGVAILSHDETQGVGTNAMSEAYLGRYAAQMYSDVAVDAYTGATITSKGVLNGVKAAAAIYAEIGR